MPKYRGVEGRPKETLAQYFDPKKGEELVTRGELLHCLDVFTKATKKEMEQSQGWWARMCRYLDRVGAAGLEWATAPFRSPTQTGQGEV
jgi:hypothetical protein